jgi:hypothetical protein
MNLYWNDCSVNGTTNKNFACNSNVGTSAIMASFVPPSGITKLVGSSAVIELQTADFSPLPSWWQLCAGGCREGAMRLDLTAPTTLNCFDYWSSAATGSFAYVGGLGGAMNRARITVSFGIPEALAGPVEAGMEYYGLQLILNNSKSIGTEACAGCINPVCMILTALRLYQPTGLGDYLLCTPDTSNYVTWQGGAVTFPDCPPMHGPPGDCNATPTVRWTWGMIKGLYR